jgi:hypothetical protein
MKRWSILLAYEVTYYAEILVDAETEEEAKRVALDAAVTADFRPYLDAPSDTRIEDIVGVGGFA